MHWLGRHRRLVLALICAICTGVIILAALFRNVIFADSIWANETGFRDALERKARRTKVHDEFVFLGLDEASKQLDQVSPEEISSSPALQKMREVFPWSRAVYADLINQLCEAGARLIIFDLTFDPDRPGNDEFRAALDRHRDRVVIGADIEATVDPQTERKGVIFVPPHKDLIPGGFLDDRYPDHVAARWIGSRARAARRNRLRIPGCALVAKTRVRQPHSGGGPRGYDPFRTKRGLSAPLVFRDLRPRVLEK